MPRVYGYYPGDDKAKGGQKAKIGMPEFYIMEYIEGRVFEDVEMPDLPSDEERREW